MGANFWGPKGKERIVNFEDNYFLTGPISREEGRVRLPGTPDILSSETEAAMTYLTLHLSLSWICSTGDTAQKFRVDLEFF